MAPAPQQRLLTAAERLGLGHQRAAMARLQAPPDLQ
jgi:hypothetical protein